MFFFFLEVFICAHSKAAELSPFPMGQEGSQIRLGPEQLLEAED